VIIQTCSLFRQLPEWEAHKTTFEDYKLHNIQPDFYGRDAELSYPHVHHIHLAQDKDQHVSARWSNIKQVYYRTHDKTKPEEDYWLIYAHDDFSNNCLLLTVIGDHAHDIQKWRSYLTSLYTTFVQPWINGQLPCAM